jgi:hypothetical protein
VSYLPRAGSSTVAARSGSFRLGPHQVGSGGCEDGASPGPDRGTFPRSDRGERVLMPPAVRPTRRCRLSRTPLAGLGGERRFHPFHDDRSGDRSGGPGTHPRPLGTVTGAFPISRYSLGVLIPIIG